MGLDVRLTKEEPFKLNKKQNADLKKVRTFTFVCYSFGVSPVMHIALLAFGFPLMTCHILLYSRITLKIEIIFLFFK